MSIFYLRKTLEAIPPQSPTGGLRVDLLVQVEKCVLPDHLTEPEVLLAIEKGYFGLEVDDAGVKVWLHFMGQPFQCEIPWHAVRGWRSNVDLDTAGRASLRLVPHLA